MNSDNDLYLYIHFPFCVKKCGYCDFYSICDSKRIPAYLDGLLLEIELYKDLIVNSNIKTIYFGGGSPNLLDTETFNSILNRIIKYNQLKTLEEFTIEINPGEISKKKLTDFATSGVNRISIGAQSFLDEELKFLDRIHDSTQIFNTIEIVSNSGIDNISLDLIYGIPGQTLEKWQYNLEAALTLDVDHYSFYNLIYESGTPLTRQRDDNLIQPLNEEIEFEMFKMAHDSLKQRAYDHYEISNWAKKGKKSQHNASYWKGSNYLGLGPSAHSCVNDQRWNNIASVDHYHKNLTKNRSAIESKESLDKTKAVAEILMLSLRTRKGLNIPEFQSVSQISFEKIQEKLNNKFNGLFFPKYGELKNSNLVLSLDGWFICDYIVQELFNITKEIKNDYKENL